MFSCSAPKRVTLSKSPRALKFVGLLQSCDWPEPFLEKNLAESAPAPIDLVRPATIPPEWQASTMVISLSAILLNGETCWANSA